jgi:pimeloyl-ACP methyl ester carboxylesterase
MFKRRSVFVLIGVVVLYTLYIGIVFVFQLEVMYPGRRILLTHEAPTFAGLERHTLQTSVGSVEAFSLPPLSVAPGSGAPAVIFAHGNGEIMDEWISKLDGFRTLGMELLLVEYPGYGRSQGTPSQETIRETIVAAYDFLARLPTVDTGRIVAYGQSLGGGAVCLLLQERPIAAAILQSTFTSTRTLAKGYFAPAFLIRDGFDNLAAVKKYPGPLLVIHGWKDEIIPYTQGLALAQAAQRGQLLLYDCPHDCWEPDRLPFWRDVRLFLEQNGIVPAK